MFVYPLLSLFPLIVIGRQSSNKNNNAIIETPSQQLINNWHIQTNCNNFHKHEAAATVDFVAFGLYLLAVHVHTHIHLDV